ncbi:methyltransferase, FxLD system [Saccharopolyspora sp. CA-218241]|uniref:methyltransferase, FxLD system n=1 Tax=Saccharopolyspora sp. CA-218241 TaxID=3240027 RepID=UPI003D9966C3
MVSVAADSAKCGALREELVGELRDLGALRSSPVEDAFRAVPRHLFVPEVPAAEAYAAEQAVVTKRDDLGVAVSSVSAARIQAFMLEQADIRPGMRVLEIGSGGYNAALIAELVGGSGEVTTLDIDPEVVGRARGLLGMAGYGHVRVVLGDGALGAPGSAPFDRVVVTAEAAEIAPAWVGQLRPDGRIVVPLRMRGLTRSVAFQRDGDGLVAEDYEVCGFVPMQGSGARAQRLVVLRDDGDRQVGLRLEPELRVDPELVRAALSGDRAESWSGVTLPPGESYADLELWLATALDGHALMTATRQARDHGVVDAWSRGGVAALLDTDGRSFAYLALRPADPEGTEYEFGAVGHGPRARQVADALASAVRSWDPAARAVLRAYPASTPTEQLSGRVLDGTAYRLTISWPAQRS